MHHVTVLHSESLYIITLPRNSYIKTCKSDVLIVMLVMVGPVGCLGLFDCPVKKFVLDNLSHQTMKNFTSGLCTTGIGRERDKENGESFEVTQHVAINNLA